MLRASKKQATERANLYTIKVKAFTYKTKGKGMPNWPRAGNKMAILCEYCRASGLAFLQFIIRFVIIFSKKKRKKLRRRVLPLRILIFIKNRYVFAAEEKLDIF